MQQTPDKSHMRGSSYVRDLDRYWTYITQAFSIMQKTDSTIYAFKHFGNHLQMGVDIDVPTINSPINSMFNVNQNNAKKNVTDTKTCTSFELQQN